MNAPIGCAQAVEQLWDHLCGDLPDADEAALEAHLSWCRRCCGELAFAQELQRMLQARSTPAMPDAAQRRLEVLIDELPLPDGGPPA